MLRVSAVVLLVLAGSVWAEAPAPSPQPPHDQPYYHPHHHATTVCIEIRPAGQHTPTKVCGPVVHGGNQPQQQQQIPQQPQQHQQHPTQERAEMPPMEISGLPRTDGPIISFGGEPKQAGPCGQAYPRFSGPMMTMAPPMLPIGTPVELDSMGWRQASGMPCPHEQMMRSVMPPPPPMMMPGGLAIPPMMHQQPGRAVYPPHMQGKSSWMVQPPHWYRQVEHSSEETDPSAKNSDSSKETLEHLMKECDEKTKLLKEKEKEIAELKTKKEAEKHVVGKSANQMPPAQNKQ